MDLLNYIGGEFYKPADGHYIENFNPATGQVSGSIPDSNDKDVAMAVQAAEEAFGDWSSCGAATRAGWLEKISKGIQDRFEEFALAESTDNGKPLSLAKIVDIPIAISNFQFYARAATQFFSHAHIMENEAVNYTLQQPLGVVGCISPWNLPIYLFSWKIAPAL